MSTSSSTPAADSPSRAADRLLRQMQPVRADYSTAPPAALTTAPLREGSLDAPLVECPWHQTVIDLRDGSVEHGPATQPLSTSGARVRAGRVESRRRQA